MTDTKTPNAPEHDKRSTTIDKELLDEITKDVYKKVYEQLKNEQQKNDQRKQEEIKKHLDYVAMMKTSPDPWVELVGITTTDDDKIEIKLEWNTPFVQKLKTSGITGINEEEIIQHWIALLFRDIIDDSDEEDSQYA